MPAVSVKKPGFAPHGHSPTGDIHLRIRRNEDGTLDGETLSIAENDVTECRMSADGYETHDSFDRDSPMLNSGDVLLSLPVLSRVDCFSDPESERDRTVMTFDCQLGSLLGRLDEAYERELFGEGVFAQVGGTYSVADGSTAFCCYKCPSCGASFSGILNEGDFERFGVAHYAVRPSFCPKCGREIDGYSDGGSPGDF